MNKFNSSDSDIQNRGDECGQDDLQTRGDECGQDDIQTRGDECGQDDSRSLLDARWFWDGSDDPIPMICWEHFT